MGCICGHPPKANDNGVGPSQDPHPSADQPVGLESVVVTHAGNKPPPPAVAPKKRER